MTFDIKEGKVGKEYYDLHYRDICKNMDFGLSEEREEWNAINEAFRCLE